MRRHPLATAVGVGLVALTLAVYWHATANGFVHYDDDITPNPHVRAGLTAPGVGWAFTTVQSANWLPLTWLSLQLDATVFGPSSAFGYHLTNVLLHAANALLLFVALWRMTAAVWRSALVAALFALHPLHVESVAWLAERKDVLSTLFAMLTLIAYARYAEAPGVGRYLAVVLALALALMAKPMPVTLPFVLLLLDYWPLGRLSVARPSRTTSSFRLLIAEKVPLLVLSAGCCVVTWYAQQRAHAISTLEAFPFGVRLANALNAYAVYLRKTLWPVDLAAFYPHPGHGVSWEQAAAAGLLLAALSAVVLWNARRLPYLGVGWLWFLGTLVPVIGLVQVGAQALADRYTYFPLVGLFLAAAWGLGDLGERWRCQAAVGAAAALVLLFCSLGTWLQVQFWRDDAALWGHTLEVTTDNALAYNQFGVVVAQKEGPERALPYFREALRINPGYGEAHFHLGVALARLGHLEEARDHLQAALALGGDDPLAHRELALVLVDLGRPQGAEQHFRAALRGDPADAVVWHNFGLFLIHQDRWEEGLEALREAVRLRPDRADFRVSLADALERRDQGGAAVKKGTPRPPAPPRG